MKATWTEVTLGEVFDLDVDAIALDPSESYEMTGVLSYGRGLFAKPPVNGSETSYKTFYRLHSGQIVLSQLFGWEGAIAPVDPPFEGRFVSSQFPTFRPKNGMDYRFCIWLLRRPEIWEQLKKAAKGMGDRRRTLSPEIFLGIESRLPDPHEQSRIAKHLDVIEDRLKRAEQLRSRALVESQALIVSTHHAAAGSRKVAISDLLELDEEKKAIEPDGSYPQVGIRSFGNGMFTKPPVSGSETTYRAFNVLREGKFVMSQVKGWEGAVAVCPQNLDGLFVSPEYRTFSCKPNACDSDYLSHIVATDWFHNQLLGATRGVGARRERVRPEMLLAIEIPFPTFEKQKKAAKVFETIRKASQTSERIAPREQALVPSLLDKVFNG